MNVCRLPRQTLERTNDENFLFVCAEYTGLRPGNEYRFKVRAVNRAGKGPWSPESFSTTTVPDIPDVPKVARVIESTLTSVTFAWDPPSANGAALIGYRVNVQHTGRVEDIPRQQVTYTLDHLLAGKTYCLRVAAMNSMGMSQYCAWNDPNIGRTKTAKPEKPRYAAVLLSKMCVCWYISLLLS